MTRITLEEARLIIGRWVESSALLLVATSEQPGDVLGRYSVVETNDDGVRFRSVGGDTQFSIDLSSFEITCSYSEPRVLRNARIQSVDFYTIKFRNINIMSRVFLFGAC
jgi:hypothetical protein